MRVSLGLFIVAFMGIGCGSAPIPTAVVEGTTATITLPAETIVGYGRAWSGAEITDPADWADSMEPAAAPAMTIPGFALEDLQRGEMILILSEISVSSGITTDITRLPVRFITRVEVDSSTNSAFDSSDPVRKGQVVVAFEVPPGLVTDAEGKRDLWIRVERYRRDVTAQPSWTFVPLPVVDVAGLASPSIGWGLSDGATAGHPIPIAIVDHPAADGAEPAAGEDFTPREGWGIIYDCPGGFNCGLKASKTPFFELLAPDFIPNPEFSILTLSTTDHPAAWEFDIEYPSHRMEIVGVTLERKMAGQAYLDWSKRDPPLPEGDCTLAPRTLDIKIVDPEALTRGVNIAFRLRNVFYYPCPDPPPFVESHLTVAQQTALAYDVDGNSIAFPALDPAYFGDN